MDPDFVYSYTRAQAIEDGVLTDVSDMARQAGFKHPVAVTAGIQAILNAFSDEQDYAGRLWDLLCVFWFEAQKVTSDTVRFSVLFRMPNGKLQDTELWAKCGPGDRMEPVITIMLIGED